MPNHLEVAAEECVVAYVESNDCSVSTELMLVVGDDWMHIMTHNLISASVRCLPKMKGPSLSPRIFSIRSRFSNSVVTFSSYAS